MKLKRSVARANPYSDHTVSRIPTGGAETDLLREIVTTSAAEPAGSAVPVRGRTVLHRGVVIVAAAAAVAAAVALGGSLLPDGDQTSAPPVGQPDRSGSAETTGTTASYRYASSVIAVAQANRRLLLDEPGWRVEYVSDFGVDNGEMTIVRQGRRRPAAVPTVGQAVNGQPTPTPVAKDPDSFGHLSLMWHPAGEYQGHYDDLTRDGSPAEPIDLLGQRGTMIQYRGTTDFTTILPPKGSNFLVIRANVGSERGYRELIAKLHEVDVQTWLDAMPASVVRPDQVHKVVDQMVADLPLPKGFDKATLYDRHVTTNRYHVGTRVSGAVACAWIGKWIRAKDGGDAAGAQEAAGALETSRSWKILRELEKQGGWSQAVWAISDEVARGQAPPDYRQQLDCE